MKSPLEHKEETLPKLVRMRHVRDLHNKIYGYFTANINRVCRTLPLISYTCRKILDKCSLGGNLANKNLFALVSSLCNRRQLNNLGKSNFFLQLCAILFLIHNRVIV